MKKMTVQRYLLFAAGVLLNGFGVAFITKAELGTTPIASIPYSLSLIVPRLSLGNFTILVSLILIALQALILKKKARPLDIILQIPISFLFGYVIDLSMLLLRGFNPDSYPARLVSILIGSVIIAFGAYFEVTADVTMLPADGFTRAISRVADKNFGTIKLITDSSQAAIALILGLIFMGRLAGVREGTIIGALLIGNLVKIIGRTFRLERVFDTCQTQ
ncbi:MAG: YitT family protein [Candidatus Weimeria sp.]